MCACVRAYVYTGMCVCVREQRRGTKGARASEECGRRASKRGMQEECERSASRVRVRFTWHRTAGKETSIILGTSHLGGSALDDETRWNMALVSITRYTSYFERSRGIIRTHEHSAHGSHAQHVHLDVSLLQNCALEKMRCISFTRSTSRFETVSLTTKQARICRPCRRHLTHRIRDVGVKRRRAAEHTKLHWSCLTHPTSRLYYQKLHIRERAAHVVDA